LKLAETIKRVGNALAGAPERFSFSNVQTGLPMDAAMAHGAVNVNGDAWRGAEDIQKMVAYLHRLKDEMVNAWRAVPPDRQNQLPAPPGYERLVRR
jgi:hypothetical protein